MKLTHLCFGDDLSYESKGDCVSVTQGFQIVLRVIRPESKHQQVCHVHLWHDSYKCIKNS